ncbi:unnamed protein product, partial [Vitis vinifera]
MLRFYSHLQDHAKVVLMYEQMQGCGVRPDAFVYPILIKSAGTGGIGFHAHVLKLGHGSDAFVRNAVIDMYARKVADWNAMVSGYWKWESEGQAQWLFDVMPERNVITWTAMVTGYAKVKDLEAARRYFDCMPERSVVSWNAMLSGYAQNGLAEEALRLFDEMLGAYRNSVTWNAMISAYMRVGDLDSARKLFNTMPGRNVVTWNSMIAGYAQNGQSAMAIELFKEMITAKKLTPDEVTMVSVISACGHLGALELGNWVVRFLTENQIKLSISGHNAMIFMYSRCGSMEDAKRVFQEMATRDVVSYNTLISGFAAHGHGVEAINLMSTMKEGGIEPDRVTFIGVLTACSHAGLLEEGRKVFESIKDPAIDHYACMVDLLGRVGELEDAKRTMERMPMEPHAGVYGSLLNASRIHKQVELGELAANKLFELEPDNSGNFILLSNIYASAGRWKDVERIREAMKKGGVKKTTGWSWVEYGGKLHKFIVADRSHERSDDIYQLLIELRKKMREAGYIADKSCVLRDVEEEEKEEIVGTHSEKLAICYALLVSEAGAVIRVVKNLRVCWDCHTAIKMISKLEGRVIIVRDNNRFHCFNDGLCSCKDYW